MQLGWEAMNACRVLVEELLRKWALGRLRR
jgi:hypothetical protein